MDKKILRRIALATMLSGCMWASSYAQNKDIDKGNEALKKAMEQKDPAKRSEGVTKAIESFTKGGMKKEMYMTIGDAYLGVKDYTNANSNYSRLDKEQKKEGMRKLADAYMEDAFADEDAKTQAKNLKKSMDFYTKAGVTEEGARGIGDRFFEKGESGYDKALEYYLIGKADSKIEQIATNYFEKGGDNQAKAAETYLKMKNKTGYTKGGDIYYNRSEYQKAIDAYLAGGITPGIEKYAEYLYSENRNEEADNLQLQLADKLSEKKDDEGLEVLGKHVMDKGSYGLAAKIYDKAGNMGLANKARAYDALVNFRLEEAKGLFTDAGDAASAKMITDNEKALMPLKDVADVLEELKKGAPFVTLLTDSVTGKSYPSPSDQKTLEDYYKSISAQVYTNVASVGANYAKLNNEELKKYVRQSFNRYGAVRNLLDKNTFVVKKQKTEIKTKDVIL